MSCLHINSATLVALYILEYNIHLEAGQYNESKCHSSIKHVALSREVNMRTSKNPLALQSQNWIFSTFTKLLSTFPYDDISVMMICMDAGIDRRTFYRYFDNKRDVLLSYMDNIFNEYLDQLNDIALPEAMEYLKLFFSFWNDQHMAFLTSLHRNGLLYIAFTENKRYLAQVNALIGKQLDRNSNEYEVAYRAGGLINVLSSWIATGCVESPDEMVSILSRILI